MSSKYLQYGALALAFACAISACSSQDSSSNSGPAASASASATLKSSKPFTAAEVKVQLTLNGELSLDAAGTVLHVPVMIDNQGSVDLDSAASPPVNIGVHLLDGSGAVAESDLVHAPLGDIRQGAKGAVIVDVPTAKLADHAIAVMPVQEGVAWFDAFGVTPLKVGPFKTCAAPDGTKTLCTGDGNAISKK